ncbi:unnamed protein product [Urochloa humidicola]
MPMTVEMMMKRHKMEYLGIGAHRGRVLRERRDGKEEPCPNSDEPQVRDDPRAVVAGQHLVLRQPGHALLVRDGNGDPIPDSPRGIPPLGDGDGRDFIPTGN